MLLREMKGFGQVIHAIPLAASPHSELAAVDNVSGHWAQKDQVLLCRVTAERGWRAKRWTPATGEDGRSFQWQHGRDDRDAHMDWPKGATSHCYESRGTICTIDSKNTRFEDKL